MANELDRAIFSLRLRVIETAEDHRPVGLIQK